MSSKKPDCFQIPLFGTSAAPKSIGKVLLPQISVCLYICAYTNNLKVLITHWEDNMKPMCTEKTMCLYEQNKNLYLKVLKQKNNKKLRFAKEEHMQKGMDFHSENPKTPKLLPVTFYIQQHN